MTTTTTKTMRFCTAPTTAAATAATAETTETITLPNITTENDDDEDDDDHDHDGKKKNNNKYKYTYHRHEKLTSKLQSESNLKKLLPTSPCRFLLSKGKDGRKTQLSKDTVTVVQNNNDSESSSDRIMIKYPKSGSTYKIRKEYLLPIIQEDNQIIVSPETDIYRKLCWVHTNQDNDYFIEIGCDFGFTSGNVLCKNKLGIDKSKTSIDIAQKNHPTDQFLEIDVLEITLQEMEDILIQYQLLQQQDHDEDENGNENENENNHGSRLVVAIDINGNRELNAVIQCLDRVLKCWKPNLVIVKSRSLYSKLIDMGY